MLSNKLRIIYYHTISDKNLKYYPLSDTISKDTFVRQIKYLRKKFRIISLNEALNKFQNKEEFKNELVITTDDGFKENYTVIAPILDDFNATFTSLVCNNLIDNKSLMWRNVLFYIKNELPKNKIEDNVDLLCKEKKIEQPKLGESLLSWSFRTWTLENKDENAMFLWNISFDYSISEFLKENTPYLNSNQINELIRNNFTIGSHSKSHPHFKNLSKEEIKEEVLEAIDELENNFKTRINAFSFPFERVKDEDFNKSLTQIISDKVPIILGTKDKGFNHKLQPTNWHRTSMEYPLKKSILNFYIEPKKNYIFK